jgi:aryl-alcohol dehydrogenase-like predicted oxidoreductase
MVNRRETLGLTLAAGTACLLGPKLVYAAEGRLIERAIPSSGEKIPVIGLGTSASFRVVAGGGDSSPLGEVLKTMVAKGATVLDTAPSYGAAEEVSGKLAKELGLTSKIFWATKVNVAKGGKADAAAARAQIEDSFRKLGTKKIDLIQVHNLADVPVQLGILHELKKQQRVRYVGVTTTNPSQYGELERVMRSEPLDFIGIDYAIDNRDVETTILPLAQERKVAVMVYVPFGRTSLFKRVGDRPVPAWASEFDATTWAQFFLKYVLGHPAVTVVTPATTKTKHMLDNVAGGVGKLPNADMRKRMVELIDGFPGA